MYNFQKIYKLNKPLFKNFLNEASSTTPDAKDIKRIEDIVAKSSNNIQTQKKLAVKMMNTIKDVNKMQRRYNAAKELLGPLHIITKTFAEGCKNLGIELNNDTTNDDLLPEPTKVEEISPDVIQAALDKQEQENNDKKEEDDIYNIDEDMLMNMPFEYINKLQKLKTYFSDQIKKLNITEKIQEALEIFKNKSNRYDIRYLNLNKFDINRGNIYISGEVVFKKKSNTQIRYSYNYPYQIGGKEAAPRSLYIQNVAYSIFENKWDMKDSNKFKWETGSYINESPAKQIVPFLNTLANAIKSFIKSQKKINNLIELYNNTVYRMYKEQTGDLFSDKTYSENQNPLFTEHHKLAEKIVGLIEDKFNVDQEPNSDDNWPGFRIFAITPGYIKFTPYLTGHNFKYYSYSLSIRGKTSPIHKSKITDLTYNEELNALLKFFTNTVGIDKNYIAIEPNSDYACTGDIIIDIRYLANALK